MEEILFSTGNGPFHSYLKTRLTLPRQQIAHVGKLTNGNSFALGDRVSDCILPHDKPAQQHELNYTRNVASNKGSRLKIQRLLRHLNDFQESISNKSMIISHFKPLPLPASRPWGIFFAPLFRGSHSAPELFSLPQKNFHF
ncbi:hypothetical protein AVEN_237817-1 [Araneus ventricosus]|uniref:Uncharacterized protein n=1 Tax=Araneus ventricosus TaxID=182803 RepID=A0A4Y2THR5_ARAVE|nr:hypothetical protein AVEN_237817-1 [Araneus ventricosus]